MIMSDTNISVFKLKSTYIMKISLDNLYKYFYSFEYNN